MADIPAFPDSREITLDDKPLFDTLLAAKRPDISAYTFTNLFAWREVHDLGVSRVGEGLVVHYNGSERRVCLEPLGDGCTKAVMEETYAAGSDLEFGYIHAQVAESLAGEPLYTAQLDRNNSDYLYLASDLIELRGRKFDAKRNFISRFKAEWEYEYLKLDERTAIECHEFAEKWCEERRCDTVDGLRREKCAVYQMLTNFGALGIVGGAIRVEGQIVAFCLGEALNPDTLVVHAEKADTSFHGLYQLTNNEFCIHEAAGFQYVNREQDLGVVGLRKAKESYQPVRMVEAWRVRRN